MYLDILIVGHYIFLEVIEAALHASVIKIAANLL
jgi:hypothetical protein